MYGGAPYGGQENAMRKGVDIVVGTPGRVKVTDRGSLHLFIIYFSVRQLHGQLLLKFSSLDLWFSCGSIGEIESFSSCGVQGA